MRINIVLRILMMISIFLSFHVNADEIENKTATVTQEIPELRGKIMRPKNWTYRVTRSGNPFTFVISKENIENYITGLKATTFVGVSKITGNSATALAAQFANEIRKSKDIIHECPLHRSMDNHRYCIETREIINYGGSNITMKISTSIVWNEKNDILGLTVFGAPEADWDSLEAERSALAGIALFIK